MGRPNTKSSAEAVDLTEDQNTADSPIIDSERDTIVFPFTTGLGENPYEDEESYEGYTEAIRSMPNEIQMWNTAGGLLRGWWMELEKDLMTEVGIPLESVEARTRPLEVLDLCSGPGSFSGYLRSFIPGLIATCVDIAPGAIEVGRREYAEELNWEFIVGDATTFRLGKTVDAVLASSGYHHMKTDEEKVAFLRTIRAHLSPNGESVGVICENLLPPYRSKKDRMNSVIKYYRALLRHFVNIEAPREAIKGIKQIWRMEMEGEQEFKVHYQKFLQHLDMAGLRVQSATRMVYPPEIKLHPRAGSHVFLVVPKIDGDEGEEGYEE